MDLGCVNRSRSETERLDAISRKQHIDMTWMSTINSGCWALCMGGDRRCDISRNQALAMGVGCGNLDIRSAVFTVMGDKATRFK